MKTIFCVLWFTSFGECFATQNLRFICKKGEHVRTVGVVYGGIEKLVPCKVTFEKTTEEPGVAPQEPWAADVQTGFCEGKADTIVERLTAQKWQCEKS